MKAAAIELCQNYGLTKERAAALLDDLRGLLINEIRADGHVAVHGIGTLKRYIRAPRQYRNPRTQEIVQKGETPDFRFNPSEKFLQETAPKQ